LGGEVELADVATGPNAHGRRAEELYEAHPTWVMLNQFVNPANARGHETLAAELFRDVGRIDYFVGGIGSAGSISGISSYVRSHSKSTKLVAVQPTGCDVAQGKVIPHGIPGIAVTDVPPLLLEHFDVELHGVMSVAAEMAMQTALRLRNEAGLWIGVSSGANVAAALELAAAEPQSNIVTIAYDSGAGYPVLASAL
jgi:cysteine synthase A